MVVDSVEILEDVIKDELRRVAIRYYSVTHSREETIREQDNVQMI